MQRRDWMRWALWSALGSSAGSTAFAQNPVNGYPKAGATLRYIVPFPPGGLTDVVARLVGQQLATRWGLNVVIDNKPGGGAQIGADAAAKSPGDGYTLLAITLAHAANATLFKGRAAFDLKRDLRPVALLAGSPMLVVVPAASPIKDFKDLVAQAHQRPLNTGSSGNGTPPHLTAELFADLTQTSLQHIPYKGGAPSLTDLIGGQLDVIFSNFPESIAHVKAGKLRALAITSPHRHPQVPDVPTTAELGLAQLQVENWTGILAPASTPDAIVDKLGAEAVSIIQSPEVAERARAQGFRIDARGPREFGSFLNAEIERWARIIAAARIQPD
jgi:tripartite-type tricarboxylate transporter receptor subunit TctC